VANRTCLSLASRQGRAEALSRPPSSTRLDLTPPSSIPCPATPSACPEEVRLSIPFTQSVDPDPEGHIRVGILLELFELRKAQDAKWSEGHVATHEPFEWAGLGAGELLKASLVPDTSEAFRRRILRACSYLLCGLESRERRERLLFPTLHNPDFQEVRHDASDPKVV
jgi:hypothetical protein